ncbi:DUF2975 domain-containing protein [Actinokineospora sp. 24-640]
MSATRDPIEPAKTLVSMLAAFVAVFTLIALIGMSTGTGSLWGLSNSEHVCAEVAGGRVPVSSEVAPVDPAVLAGGVQVATGDLRLCARTPTGAQRVLGVAAQFPAFLLLVGTLLLAVGLFRLVDRDGLFTGRAVTRLRRLGWFVMVGNVVVSVVQAVSASLLAGSMVTTEWSGTRWLDYWEPSIIAVVLGAVLVSVARVLHLSTVMREDLEGTV